jgi:uncharacterized protein with von Willebrand factor type A (vWA) domain
MIVAFVLGVDEGFPEHGIHFLVLDRGAILTEELANQHAIGTIDLGSLCRSLIDDSVHRGRLSEEIEEIDVDSSKIEEESDNERNDSRKNLDVPGTYGKQSLVPSPSGTQTAE